MTGVSFSAVMDRSRLDALEHEIAQLVIELLRTYDNRHNQVHKAFLEAGRAIYAKQYWSMNAFDDLILVHSDGLLRIARQHDGAWKADPDLIDNAIAASPEKHQASVEEIAAEITALATRFEDQGYQPIEIGRSLAAVGLSLAPVGFIDKINWIRRQSLEGRAERERHFLDERLDENRYPANKETSH